MPVTQEIAEFATRSRASASPNGVAVGRVIADTVAVAIAGLNTEPGAILLDLVRGEQAPGRARVWGTDLMLAPSQAALVNGTTAHALDWDDAVPKIPFHPGAVLVPALLAQLAVDTALGQRLAVAYDVGSAVSRALSGILPVGWHYGRGWHNTSTTGRLAATAALAHLAGLDEGTTRHAMGIAASSAAGLVANFGTMTKSLHAGQAAQDAVRAIALARRGFTANLQAVEGPKGFLATYGRTSPELLTSFPARLDHWETHWVKDWAIKRHPSCFATHRAVDAVLVLREQIPDVDRVCRVEASVPATEASPLLPHPPATGLEGKFSLAYTVCRALVSGPLTLSDFTDERVHDPVVQRMMESFATEDRRGSSTDAFHTSVRVTLDDGRVLHHGVDQIYGDATNPLTDIDFAEKFAAAVGCAGASRLTADRLLDRLLHTPSTGDLTSIQNELGVLA